MMAERTLTAVAPNAFGSIPAERTLTVAPTGAVGAVQTERMNDDPREHVVVD